MRCTMPSEAARSASVPALVAQRDGTLLHADAAELRLAADLEELREADLGALPRVLRRVDGLLDVGGRALLDPQEDALEQRELAGEVVVERALGDAGGRDDLVERGAGVAVIGEQLRSALSSSARLVLEE